MLEVPLTVRLTPLSGRNSIAAATNSLPYLVVNKLRRCISSGKSEHLPDANIILAIASRSSKGHSLVHEKINRCNHILLGDKKVSRVDNNNLIQAQLIKQNLLLNLNNRDSCQNKFTEKLHNLICSQYILLPNNVFHL